MARQPRKTSQPPQEPAPLTEPPVDDTTTETPETPEPANDPFDGLIIETF